MTIIRTGLEKAKGAFKVLLGGAVAVSITEILRNIIKEKGADVGLEFIKSLATGKGLENEAIYGQILDRCALKTDERSLLIHAIEELRLGTKKEKEAANNFIVLVALGNPDNNGDRPGKQIIHGFIHRIKEYPTDAKKVQMLKDNIVHIGTNAEVKTKIDSVEKWASEVWKQQIEGLPEQLDVISATYKTDSIEALKEFNERPWWKKAFFNESL